MSETSLSNNCNRAEHLKIDYIFFHVILDIEEMLLSEIYRF